MHIYLCMYVCMYICLRYTFTYTLLIVLTLSLYRLIPLRACMPAWTMEIMPAACFKHKSLLYKYIKQKKEKKNYKYAPYKHQCFFKNI